MIGYYSMHISDIVIDVLVSKNPVLTKVSVGGTQIVLMIVSFY